MRKTIAGIAMGATVLAGGAASATIFAPNFVAAQDADDTTTDDAATDDASAGEERVRRTLADVLAPLVDDGTIDQAQADAVIAAIEEARPEGRRGHKGHRGFGASDVVVEALGVTADELRDALRGGSTIADVAAEQGVDVQTVIDAIVAAGQERLDQAVADGKLTEEEAADKAAALEEKATALVNGEIEFRRGGRHGHGPRGGGGTDAADDTTDA